MPLPINKSKLPSKIKGEALIDLVVKTGGEYGKRPKKSEVKKFFKGTEISRRPYEHLSREKALRRLKEAYQHFGIKESGKQILKKEINRIQTREQTPQSVKKSFKESFLGRLLRGRKTSSSSEAYRLSQQRRIQSLPPQAPTSSSPQNLNKPNFPPTKLPPGIAK